MDGMIEYVSRTCFPNSTRIIAIFWRDCYCFVNHHFFDGSCQHIDAVLLNVFCFDVVVVLFCFVYLVYVCVFMYVKSVY